MDGCTLTRIWKCSAFIGAPLGGNVDDRKSDLPSRCFIRYFQGLESSQVATIEFSGIRQTRPVPHRPAAFEGRVFNANDEFNFKFHCTPYHTAPFLSYLSLRPNV
jgi:hypothetical protein